MKYRERRCRNVGRRFNALPSIDGEKNGKQRDNRPSQFVDGRVYASGHRGSPNWSAWAIAMLESTRHLLITTIDVLVVRRMILRSSVSTGRKERRKERKKGEKIGTWSFTVHHKPWQHCSMISHDTYIKPDQFFTARESRSNYKNSSPHGPLNCHWCFVQQQDAVSRSSRPGSNYGNEVAENHQISSMLATASRIDRLSRKMWLENC